jgi:acetyl/propionyl-CoA carboxylase alpha subunit
VTGIDLVHEQIRVAGGEPLEVTGRAPRRGHALEVRVNAEDPARSFLPAPGAVARFRPPLGPGVRVDTHLEEGAVVPPHYDSLVAKVIVWGLDRERSLARAVRALNEFEVTGIPTTIGVAAEVIRSEGFARGDYSTSYLEDVVAVRPDFAEAEA